MNTMVLGQSAYWFQPVGCHFDGLFVIPNIFSN